MADVKRPDLRDINEMENRDNPPLTILMKDGLFNYIHVTEISGFIPGMVIPAVDFLPVNTSARFRHRGVPRERQDRK